MYNLLFFAFVDAPPLSVNISLLNISSTEVLLGCYVTSINRLIATPPTLELIFADTVLYTSTGSSNQIFRLDRVQTLSGVYRCNAKVTIVDLNVTVNGTGNNHFTIPGIYSFHFPFLFTLSDTSHVLTLF